MTDNHDHGISSISFEDTDTLERFATTMQRLELATLPCVVRVLLRRESLRTTMNSPGSQYTG